MEEHTVSQENTSEQKQKQQQALRSAALSTGGSKTRGPSKASRSAVGGSAVPGAKSTQPKQAPTTNNPREQQAETYNRQMRRRMEHLGTGAYDEGSKMQKAQQQRKKRIERKKLRLEQQRQEIRKTMPKGGIKLGRSTLYFIVGTTVLVILIIALFIIFRHPF
jgi:cobalamin biosynthesis Mg chelatase CobN